MKCRLGSMKELRRCLQSRDVRPKSKEPRGTRGSFILIQLADRYYLPTGKKYAIPAVAI